MMMERAARLHRQQHKGQREDFEARVYAAATLDDLTTGALNPGVRSGFYKVYRVSQERLAQGGWYIRFANGTELPILQLDRLSGHFSCECIYAIIYR